MIEGRFIVYGVLPEHHDDNNADFDSAFQKIGHTVPIYGTDDKQEAKDMVQVHGGFMRGEGESAQWYAAVWAKDTVGGGTIGAVPEGA